MQRKLPFGLRVAGALSLFIVVVVAAWWGLGQLEPHPQWLRVEGARRAVVGKPLRLRVHLAPVAEPTCVCADLRGGALRDRPMSGLVCGAIRPVGKEGGDFDFEFLVPPRDRLRFVSVVIYLTRTGRWEDRTMAADTEMLSATTNMADKVEARLEPLRLQPDGGGASNANHVSTPLPRRLTGLLFLAAMVVAWRAGRRRIAPGRRQWQALAVFLALAGLWELLGLEGWLDARLRTLACAEDVYSLRVGLQKVVVSLMIAGTLLFLMVVRRVRGPMRLLVAVSGLYAALAALNVVSLHAIDVIAGLSWQGISLMRALKLACVITILWLAQRFGAVAGQEAGAEGTGIDALEDPAREDQLHHDHATAPAESRSRYAPPGEHPS
jgi:hypothetical protein